MRLYSVSIRSLSEAIYFEPLGVRDMALLHMYLFVLRIQANNLANVFDIRRDRATLSRP